MTSLRATPLTALPPQFGPHAAGACPTRLGGTYANGLRVVQEFDGGVEGHAPFMWQRGEVTAAFYSSGNHASRYQARPVEANSPAYPCGELPIMVMGNYRVGMSLLPCPLFSNIGEPRW